MYLGSVCFLLVIFFGNDAIELRKNCRWNYTLQSLGLTDDYYVEMEDFGSDCSGLYNEIPSYKMDSGRSDIAVNLSDTENPSLQNLNISWNAIGGAHEYLLTFMLKVLDTKYTTSQNDMRCIHVQVKQANATSQLRTWDRLFFDCLQIRTGTVKAVLETVIHTGNPGFPNCETDRPARRCPKPKFLSTNIDADCCPMKLTLRDVQLQTKDGCTWVLSVNTKGLSAWDYVLIRSNRTIASRGALVSTKQNNLSARLITVDFPDVYEIMVSFWCSFDPDEHRSDHKCFNVTKKMNATLCNRQTHTEKVVADKAKIKPRSRQPMIITALTLGCVAAVAIVTAFVFSFCRKGFKICCRKTRRQPRNNQQSNDTDGTLISATDLQQVTPEMEVEKDKEESQLMVTLPE